MEQDFFSEEIIRYPLEADSREDAIRQMGEWLTAAGYATEDYVVSVLTREVDFPTGLKLQNAGIAIPHATPEGNVIKSGIAVAKLAEPVAFQSMENPEESVEAEMIFLLALKDQQHLAILKSLFLSFQQPQLVQTLMDSKNAEELLGTLRKNLEV